MTALLHAHTEYSHRDSLIRVGELPKLALDAGYSACAITDHGSISGAVDFHRACKTAGIKPIIGCEVYVRVSDADKDPKSKKYHLTVLTKSAKGFGTLCRLMGDAAFVEDGKSVLPLESLLEGAGQDIVILSGCYSSPFWRGGSDAYADFMKFLKAYDEDFFLEVMPLSDWDKQVMLNRMIVELAQTVNRPLVVTGDAHFACAEDSKHHDALLAVANRKSILDPSRWQFSTKLNWVMNRADTLMHLSNAGLELSKAAEALDNTALVEERCEAWEFPTDRLPIASVSEHPDDELVELVGKALVGRAEDYYKRAEYELETLITAGLSEYLLLVRKCVSEFRKRGAFIGPRGSVGGCLVAHLLGISNVDPLKHDLIFERWYSPGRGNMPDVDLDLPHEFRARAPEILAEVFGAKNVAQVGTVQTYQVRAAVRDAAKAYAVDMDETIGYDAADEDAWTKSEAGFSGHSLAVALKDRSPEAFSFAEKLFGRVRHAGAHPGGFVICRDPINQIGRGFVKDGVLCWPLDVAESLGFLKIDFLANGTLDILAQFDGKVNFEEIPLDAADVFLDFEQGRTAGIPQFNSFGMKAFVRMLKPRSFYDLIFANAAFRPGGLGQMSPAKLVETYRQDPDALIIFQEQLMSICVNAAGFSWQEADAVRKTMAKSEGVAAMRSWENKFVQGCVKTGSFSVEEAGQIWTQLSGWGRYGFCKSHATAYTQNAYRCGWLKRKFPFEFYAAALNAAGEKTKSDDSVAILLDEIEDLGLPVLPVDLNLSGNAWQGEETGLRRPFSDVAGMTKPLIAAIMAERGLKAIISLQDLSVRLKKRKLPAALAGALESKGNERQITLYRSPALDALVDETRTCILCDRRKTCKAPVPVDPGIYNALVVGQDPGAVEDRRGKPFQGESGKLLIGLLDAYGIDRKQIGFSNVIKCRSTDPNAEKPYCPWLDKELEILAPPLVLAVGRSAWEALGGKGSILKANATVYKSPTGRQVVACIHPAAVLRDNALYPEFERAVKKFSKLFHDAEKRDEKPPDSGVQHDLGF